MPNSNNSPVKKFRSSNVSVAIWKNEGTDKNGEPKLRSSVTLQRVYTDKNTGETVNSEITLFPEDLHKAMKVLEQTDRFLNVVED